MTAAADVFDVTTSQFEEECIFRLLRQGEQEGEHLRRGTLRHVITGVHLWTRDPLAEAIRQVGEKQPALAGEFAREIEEITTGIALALDRLGPLPDEEDVLAIEMFEPDRIPPWARATVRGNAGIRVSMTDEYGLATGGLDFAYHAYDDHGRKWLEIANWKGRRGGMHRQAQAEAVLGWRLGWADGCYGIRHTQRGLVFPWVESREWKIGEMVAAAREVLGWIEEIHRASLMGDPPRKVNAYCASCSLKASCPEVVIPLDDPDATTYLGGPIRDEATDRLLAAIEHLEPRTKAGKSVVDEIDAEIRRRIEAGEIDDWEIKKTPAGYGDKPVEKYIQKALAMGFKETDLVKYLDPGKLGKAIKARAALIGKAGEIDDWEKSIRGEPTKYKTEVVPKVTAPAAEGGGR